MIKTLILCAAAFAVTGLPLRAQATNTFPSSGSVGIGDTTPDVKLHVYSASDTRVRVESTADGFPGFELAEAGVRKWLLFNNTNDNFVLRTGSVDRLVVKSTGEVGIGTTTPTHRLSVNGSIRAKEVVVDTGWADDVFLPGYRLAPLSEVEKHIETKGHLPGIPSAAEVASKGVSIGETQSLLLRKIEELTLHLIAQEKEMANLRKEVARLTPQAGQSK